jgi:predicted transcriptional regulator
MPRKANSRKLTSPQKVSIAFDKAMTKKTNAEIASAHGIVDRTVRKYNYQSLSNEEKAEFNRKAADYKFRLQSVADILLDRIETLAVTGEDVTLHEVVGAFKIVSEQKRLEAGEATTITETRINTDEMAAVELLKRLVARNFTIEQARAAAEREFPSVDPTQLLEASTELDQSL